MQLLKKISLPLLSQELFIKTKNKKTLQPVTDFFSAIQPVQVYIDKPQIIQGKGGQLTYHYCFWTAGMDRDTQVTSEGFGYMTNENRYASSTYNYIIKAECV